MIAPAIATLIDHTRVRGVLTTEHAASSYGQPVFVGADGQAINWASISDISTTGSQSDAGKVKSRRKARTSKANGAKGGRPRKEKGPK